MTQLTKGYRCHICGSDKHKKSDCTKKNLPREQWFITKAMDKMLHQRDDDENSDDDENESDDDDDRSVRTNSSRTRSTSRNRGRGRSRARRQSDQEDWCSFQHDWSNMQCANDNENDDDEIEADIVLEQNNKTNKVVGDLKKKFVRHWLYY